MSRGVTPVVGVVLLVVVTMTLAAVVGGSVATTPGESPPIARFAVSADADDDRITVIHRGGEAISPTDIRLVVEIDGTRLAHQPPVPFFATRGFESGPTGPLNSASNGQWRAGERATIRLAATNEPQLAPGARVTVTVATDRSVVGVAETRAA